MMNIFFIADVHFGDPKVLRHTPRFQSIEEYDNYVFDRWLEIVRPSDVVYCIGDIGEPTCGKVWTLPGVKHLIVGNHEEGYTTQDYAHYRHSWYGDTYMSVRSYNTVYSLLMLSHLPLHPITVYPGYVNVHGHIHDKAGNNPRALGEQYYNVGAMLHQLAPIPIERIINIKGVGNGRKLDGK